MSGYRRPGWAEQPPSGWSPQQQPRHSSPFMSGFAGCGGAFVFFIILMGIAFAACASMAKNATSSNGGSSDNSSSVSAPTAQPDDVTNGYGDVTTTGCSGTCAQYDHMTLTVVAPGADRNSAMDGFKPDPGMHFVWMRVDVVNGSGATEDQELNSTDFSVVGPDGQVEAPLHLTRTNAFGLTVQDNVAGCGPWDVTLASSGGDTGPRVLCFQVGGDVNGSLALRWIPRLLGKTVDVSLP